MYRTILTKMCTSLYFLLNLCHNSANHDKENKMTETSILLGFIATITNKKFMPNFLFEI